MSDIRSVEPTWDAGLIVVCRACEGYAKSLRRGLKEALAAEGLRKHVRIVESSCLDVCPKRATTVVIATRSGTHVAIVPEDEHDAQALAPLLRQVTRPSGGGAIL